MTMHPANPFGPFYRRFPTPSTTIEEWRYCWVYYDTEGHECIVEWLP